MPTDQIGQHLKGLSGWVQQVLADKDKDQLMYILAKIHYVQLVIGCVIEPGFDKSGEAETFLFNFNAQLHGLLFTSNTLFDFDGAPIAGMMYDARK